MSTQTLNREHFKRPVFIHVCKDKTLSYRRAGQPIFNGAALPAFTVEDEAEAQALLVLVGRAQYEEHPLLPRKTWYKITLDGDLDFKRYLDLEDMDAVSAKLAERYALMKSLAATQKPTSMSLRDDGVLPGSGW